MAGLHGIDEGDQKAENLFEQRPDGQNRDLPEERQTGKATCQLALGGIASERVGAGQERDIGIGAWHGGFHRQASPVGNKRARKN